MERRENVLYVQTFNGFSLEWNGKRLINGKAKESQFSYLLQMILHYRDSGVSRDEIKAALFEERDLENANHALQSVIYNAKRRLKAAGLPQESGYIRRMGERYYWTDTIPVIEDAGWMEQIFEKAETEMDPDRKLALYLNACYIYTGDFLNAGNNALWVAQEAKKYHYLFCVSTERAAELLREEGAFSQLERLGLYASRIDPLANWETLTMEALVASGRHQEAKQFYNDTMELYRRELGVSPSRNLQSLMRQLGQKLEHGYGVLEQIQTELSREDVTCQGGYLCSYPVFLGIYQMLQRLLGRGGQAAFLMLCTIVDGKGNPLKEGPKLERLSKKLESAICHVVRRCDAVNRYGRGQYLVLLVNTTRENCVLIRRRIDREFIENRQRIRVQYHIGSVEEGPESGKLLSDEEGE